MTRSMLASSNALHHRLARLHAQLAPPTAARPPSSTVVSATSQQSLAHVEFPSSADSLGVGPTTDADMQHKKAREEDPYHAWDDERREAPCAEAVHAVGIAGSVCVIDCRLWLVRVGLVGPVGKSSFAAVSRAPDHTEHPFSRLRCASRHCLPPNHTDDTRAMVNVRYGPKWVPLERLVGTDQGQPPWPRMPAAVYDALPPAAKPMYEHAPLPPPPPSAEDWEGRLFPASEARFRPPRRATTTERVTKGAATASAAAAAAAAAGFHLIAHRGGFEEPKEQSHPIQPYLGAI
eukprot:SAG11_NODE_418_length_9653_cov_2.465564_4_plen_291_part_00